MNTPICDFLEKYAQSGTERFHMPAHKGSESPFDITEIAGADSLYEADGIIKESEKNASSLFGCDTFYSTEGSSHCIRAMLFMLSKYAKLRGEEPLILAARNAHRAFINAAVLCDFNTEWIYPENSGSFLSCPISASLLDRKLNAMPQKPVAVYLTSPDYLGNLQDIKALSEVCRRYGVLLCVDNAHGAYLKFLNESLHPIDLGADLCCDSAHKTLPVLTGGAYLHVSDDAPQFFHREAKAALSLFGTTSPSYLILASLDRANRAIKEMRISLPVFAKKCDDLKEKLINHGYEVLGTEALKITILTSKYGYLGADFADILRKKGIECEFSDRNTVVFMLSPLEENCSLEKLCEALLSIEKRESIYSEPPQVLPLEIKTSPREAAFMDSEQVPVLDAVGRTSAFSTVSCPPAVAIAVCGEIISPAAAETMLYYGKDVCSVIKE